MKDRSKAFYWGSVFSLIFFGANGLTQPPEANTIKLGTGVFSQSARKDGAAITAVDLDKDRSTDNSPSWKLNLRSDHPVYLVLFDDRSVARKRSLLNETVENIQNAPELPPNTEILLVGQSRRYGSDEWSAQIKDLEDQHHLSTVTGPTMVKQLLRSLRDTYRLQANPRDFPIVVEIKDGKVRQIKRSKKSIEGASDEVDANATEEDPTEEDAVPPSVRDLWSESKKMTNFNPMDHGGMDANDANPHRISAHEALFETFKQMATLINETGDVLSADDLMEFNSFCYNAGTAAIMLSGIRERFVWDSNFETGHNVLETTEDTPEKIAHFREEFKRLADEAVGAQNELSARTLARTGHRVGELNHNIPGFLLHEGTWSGTPSHLLDKAREDATTLQRQQMLQPVTGSVSNALDELDRWDAFDDSILEALSQADDSNWKDVVYEHDFKLRPSDFGIKAPGTENIHELYTYDEHENALGGIPSSTLRKLVLINQIADSQELSPEEKKTEFRLRYEAEPREFIRLGYLEALDRINDETHINLEDSKEDALQVATGLQAVNESMGDLFPVQDDWRRFNHDEARGSRNAQDSSKNEYLNWLRTQLAQENEPEGRVSLQIRINRLMQK